MNGEQFRDTVVRSDSNGTDHVFKGNEYLKAKLSLYQKPSSEVEARERLIADLVHQVTSGQIDQPETD